MNKVFLALLLFVQLTLAAQKAPSPITFSEVTRIETVLASDEMQGRRSGTPGSDKAAAFIAEEFRKAGLQPAAGTDMLQFFTMLRPKFKGLKAEIDDVDIDTKNVVVFTSEKDLKVNEKSGYAVSYLKAGDNFGQKLGAVMQAQQNAVVFVDTSFRRNFSRLTSMKRQMFSSPYSFVFVLGDYQPKEFTFKAEHDFEETNFANVVGIIPGKSKPNEYVIFSAHYDHLGIGKAVDGDSIYNGANDDAAGTTAVIMLAKHFAQFANNERTLVFAAFTAEEMGGFGSQYFSRQFKPDQVMAMFNIEMIGTESKWGKNSAFITGYEVTDMGRIMQENLKGTAFTFHPDPYPQQSLFYRSDNATLARLGVPAHTISTAKMESEPHYHKLSDEVETLDLQNMTEIIKAIALSSASIIQGRDTPSRVKTETLR